MIKNFLPSLGYFGASDSGALRLSIPFKVSAIRISLQCSTEEILNLKGLKLLCRGTLIPLNESSANILQSSCINDDARYGGQSLIAINGIHTKREPKPFWQANFNTLLDFDTVILLNRGDEWGCRSRTLLVEVMATEGSWTEVYKAISGENVASILLEGIKAAGNLNLNIEMAEGEVRSSILDAVSARLLNGDLSLSQVNWDKLLQFTNIWNFEVLNDHELSIIAAKCLHDKIVHRKCDLSDVAFAIRTRGDVALLQDRINKLATFATDKVYVVTRHGLQEAVLQSKTKEFVALLKLVIEILDEYQLKPVLAYGTLLGAIRDGKFIPHDDDVDLLYLTSANNRTEAEIEVKTILSRFEKLGYIVTRFPNCLNAHVFDVNSSVSVDIFPCWVEGEDLYLHMQSMKIGKIHKSILYPSASIEFYACKFPVPGQYKEFLIERYGSSWENPDQFFEWPWPLKD